MEKLDFIIIGAGVVGLAVAAELSGRYGEQTIIVLEKHAKFGQETSSRNSEVIHAGMYYPADSLKARLCVEGNSLMYSFCGQYDVPFQKIGKLIIARNDGEIPAIESILSQGEANKVKDLQWLDQSQVKKLEPSITAAAAVYSPATGIVDSHKLMARLEYLALQNSAMIAYKSKLTAITKLEDGYEVICTGPDGEEERLACRWLINCAGLEADFIPAYLGINIVEAGYKVYPVKGEYFSVSAGKSKMVSHLIYPPPLAELKGLGTHVTKSLDGRARLGPNAFYVERTDDYDVDPAHLEEFFAAARTYLSFIERQDLQPDMAGIRPKIQAPGAPAADFIICHETARGLPGLINLAGIESPGLTSSLAIAKHVAHIVSQSDE